MNYQPLHLAQSVQATVLYRNGAEVVDSAKHKKQNTKERYLITYGTFGPILGLVRGVLTDPRSLTWSRWEQDASGRRAVFRYAVPLDKSLYRVWSCCLPDGDGTVGLQIRAVYRGEIAVDPTSGAILRLEAKADLQGFVPLHRSDVVVEYGPVDIGGKSFMCPTRRVSVMRSRSVMQLREWGDDFRTYGPYATTMNDISFDDYHMFRADSRMLTDYKGTADPDSRQPQ